MTEALISIAVVLLLNIIAFAYTCGRLIQRINHIEDIVLNDLQHTLEQLDKRMGRIEDRLSSLDQRLSRIEGKMGK